MDEKTFADQLLTFFTKLGSYPFAIAMGLVGKIGYEMMLGKRYTTAQWLGIGFVSVFFGYTTSVMCHDYQLETLEHFAPSLATMFGQQISIYMVNNYSRILSGIVKIFIKK